jgi:type IX secretion system PorP/SprF family membrane protein
MYTQYTFNKAGMNPAASGTDIDKEYNYVFGTNRQWVDYDNAPKQLFFNLSYTIRPPRSYKSWQNVGVYIDSDNSGLIGSTGIYANYTFHLLIRKKIVASFGVYAGVRKYSRALSGFDDNDPAVSKAKSTLILYPDIIPGFRLSDKKYFFGVSARQITINKLQDFKGHKIGNPPSKLYPTLYLEFGRMITLTDNLLMMPSMAVNTPIISLPIVDASVMFYYANRIGLGGGIRNTSFVSGMFQIRFLENLTAGFAYSYPINLTRYVAQNSYEIMIGVVPMGMNTKLTGRHSIAKCPVLSY